MPNQEEKERLSSEIASLVQQFIHIDDDMDSPSLMTGCLVIFESSLYDSEGNMMFKVDFFTPGGGTSVVQSQGLVRIADNMMQHRMFGHCDGHG